MQATRKPSRFAFWLLAFVLLWIGCSRGDRPPLGKVRGVITLDGKPTPGLGIIFSTPGFRSSTGLTNDQGEYELNYIKEVMGAVVGTHVVKIDFMSREADGQKQLPKKYNRESELTREVERGRNVFDFELEST